MAVFQGASTVNFDGTDNFSPKIFAQKVLMFFRTASVVEGITNNDYFGEISGFGDTVRIIKEPKLQIASYDRGKTTISQALDDAETTLEISKANYFQFQVDDIEEKLSHVNWQSLAQGSATYALKNSYDKEVLEFMANKCIKANIVNTSAGITAASTDVAAHLQAQETTAQILLGFGTGETDPLNLLSLLALKLDEQDIPEEGRWVVVSPRFMELLSQTQSVLLSSDFNQGEGGLKNGLVMNGKLRGFSVYKTNNSTKFFEDTDGTAAAGGATGEYTGTGSDIDVDFDPDFEDPQLDQVTTADTDADDELLGTGDNQGGLLGDVIMAGHMTSTATASAIEKAEVIRSELTFADIVRGLHVYGRGVLYPEALTVAYVQYA